MPVSENNRPKVRLYNNDMEAYLQLPYPEEGETYTVEYVKAVLEEQGVKYGLLETVINKMVTDGTYNQDVLVAKGLPSKDGFDGYYEYNFNATSDKTPTILPDGSVDYWTVHNIEAVSEDQIIAVYHPAIQGTDGVNVKGIPVTGKRGKELALLKGKGFKRDEDEVTYRSEMDGKIEMQGDRIIILPVHELNGNAEITGGNIDFRGDIVIHGSVESGIIIKASGSITIEGVVEACTIEAGKDIILRSGMLGGNKASVKTKGNIFAKFFENTTVEAEGSIQADVLMNCTVNCKEKIILSGKRGSIIGGVVHAIQGIEVSNLGNQAEMKTEVYVGSGEETIKRLKVLQIKAEATRAELQKVESGLKQFEAMEKERGISYANDPRRMSLLRIRIRDMASLSEDEAEIKKIRTMVDRAKGACVTVNNEVFPGVHICIDDERMLVKNNATHVEFYLLESKIRTRSAG